MSHPDEALLVAYVDDALDGSPRNELETHLVRCRECRGRVVDLRDESTFLGDVLTGRERPVAVSAPVPDTEASVAIGVPFAVAGVTLLLGVIGTLLESRIPGGLDLFNPLRLKGAYEMAFDFLFFLRDTAPGLVELMLALAAVASVSALLTFGVGLLYRHLFGATAALLLALVFTAAEPARALEMRVDQDVHVATGEVIEDSMVVTGDRARIDGVVKGDLVAAVERIQISGKVEGNLYVFTRNLDITGEIVGSVHTIAERARIDGSIDGNCMAISEDFTVTSEARIGRNGWLIVSDGVVDGRFERDLMVTGGEFEMRGEVGRNLAIRFLDEALIGREARIGGNIDSLVHDEEDLEIDPEAQIGGEVKAKVGKTAPEHYLDAYKEPRVYIMHAIGFVAAFAFGLLIHALLPGVFTVGIRTSQDFFRSLGFGFILLVVPPVAIVLTGLTVVGLPAAVLAGFLYITCLYLAEILVGVWLGRTFLGPEDTDSRWSFARVFFVGFAALSVAAHLPFIGPPVTVVALLVGLGLVFQRVRQLPVFSGA